MAEQQAANVHLPETSDLVWGYLPKAIRVLLRQGFVYFLKGSLPGVNTRSQQTQNTFRYWIGPIVGTTVSAFVCFGYANHDRLTKCSTTHTKSPNTLKYIAYTVGGICTSMASFFTLFAAAIERYIPPPKRPFCQLDCLPFDENAPQRGVLEPKNHPLFPFYKETDLIEYIPNQIWIAQIPLRFLGYQLGSRMVLLRIGEDFLIYSPVPLTSSIFLSVKSLCNSPENVKWIIASNSIHHLFITDWTEKFPNARVYAAPKLKERRPDIKWTAVIDSTHCDVPNGWDRKIVDFVVMKSNSFHEEIVLCHHPTRTLIVSDIVENFGHEPETSQVGDNVSMLDRMMVAQRPGPPVDLKAVVDPVMYREAVNEILKWDFDRIVLAHGRLVECEARETFMDAFAFLIE